jgi:hypothetical protein
MADEHPHSRRARLAARRRRIRWAGVLAVALIVGAAGTVAAFAFTDDAPSGPSAAVLTGATNPRNGAQSTSTTTTPAEALNVRPLSHADPLRLWVGGDSLSGALGPSLGTLAGDTGIVDTYVDYKVSSGLVPSTRNWQVYAPELIAQQDPEAIVFMIGTNDANVVNSVDANKDGIHDWEVDYRERVANMMDLFVGGEKDRTVIWIGAPTMRDSQRDKGVLEINRVMREEGEKRGPHVIYVDAYQLFSDENGEYSDRLDVPVGPESPGETKSVRVRVGDGVHLTPAGADYLATPVFSLLDSRYRLTAQADHAHPINYTLVKGGELADSSRSGTSKNSGTKSGSGTGTKKYTATTAPRVVSTPTTADAPSETSPATDPTTPTTAAQDPGVPPAPTP